MKQIGIVLALVIGMGMMFSSTCKQDKREVPSPVDTSGNPGGPAGPPTTAYFNVFVAPLQLTAQDQSNVIVNIYKDSATMHAQERAGNTLAGVFMTATTTPQGSGTFATFTKVPVATGGTTYWIWATAFTYQGSSLTGDTSITLSAPCNTCGFSATVRAH